MKKKMSIMGVGHKIAIPLLLWVAVTETISLLAKPTFSITSDTQTLLIIGLALIAVGFTLNLAAAFTMMKAHKENRLATTGMYALFRDPMYTVMIFLTLPGLFLLLNSWLVLPGVIPVYIACRVFVKEEHRYLEEIAGAEYKEYLQKVKIRV